MNLFPHQHESALTLAGRPAAVLGDLPGTGKTRTLLAAALYSGDLCPTVVCPANARNTWAAEAGVLDMDPGIISYDGLVRHDRRALDSFHGNVLLVDEVHKLKHFESERTQRVLSNTNGIAQRYERVYFASGTFMPKNPMDLWPVLSKFFPRVLGSYGIKTRRAFMETFCVVVYNWSPRGPEPKVVGVSNAAILRALLSQVIVTSAYTPGLPDLQIVPWTLDLTGYKSDDAFTERLVSEALAGDGDLSSLFESEHLATERQNIGKFIAPLVAAQIIEQLEESDEKVVVFAYHHAVLDLLFGAFVDANLSPSLVTGKSGDAERAAEIRRFQEEPTARVYLGQNNANMEAITLTAAHRAVLVEPDWTATNNVQLGRRVARIGQQYTGPCVAQLVTLPGTLSEAITRNHFREMRMQTQVFPT